MNITYLTATLFSVLTLINSTKDVINITNSLFSEAAAIAGKEEEHIPRSLSTHTLGSAEKLEGSVVVVSVFADDRDTGWDLTKSEDLRMYEDTHSYVSVAVDKIVEWGKEWGKDIQFIWDWEEYSDLKYTAKFSVSFDQELLDSNKSEDYAWDYIESSIDSDALLTKYDADNILYLMFFDSPQTCKTITCTRAWYKGMEKPYEICYLYTRDIYYNMNPGVIAHEILHTFSAPDLYGTDQYYGIGKDYADRADEEGLDDIMLIIPSGPSYFDRITVGVTEITAYYLGWTDSSETVNKWNFRKNHFS